MSLDAMKPMTSSRNPHVAAADDAVVRAYAFEPRGAAR